MGEMYSTSDLYLAAYLKYKGNKLNIEKNGKKMIFLFPKTDELNGQILEYLNDEATFQPLSYTNSIKNLKNLIYNM
jgi:hypothetical protein